MTAKSEITLQQANIRNVSCYILAWAYTKKICAYQNTAKKYI